MGGGEVRVISSISDYISEHSTLCPCAWPQWQILGQDPSDCFSEILIQICPDTVTGVLVQIQFCS